MGRTAPEWVDEKAAAEILNCTRNHIRKLAMAGTVRSQPGVNGLVLRKQDVEEILDLHGNAEMSEADMRKRIVLLEQSTKRLHDALDLMYKANGLSSLGLGLDDDHLVSLSESVRSERGAQEWPVARLLSSCEVYIGLNEDDVDRLNSLLDIDDAWRPFLELCLVQSRYVATHPNLGSDFNLQQCRYLFAMARKNLREIAVVFIELQCFYIINIF